ncbi:hypothetical protein C474_13214 [Halogeometricum pallidum JCM 14848]|uniref:DUF368 domain-containing protein n=1 Tax=Halogeometricum pallidum JCM 14848 TaxID=1227487 RepID=M0D1W4_HALPD|nr:DUF368 domain-containing protein [Halogeometricum pallidum]ELZ29435.1 hypothetical protein C474_13214 [Halogeometricum pallidum JCM 14848]
MSKASDDARGEVTASWLVVFFKGVCMGAADAVPGVSGGTIALVTGIYERLIAAVTAVSPGRIVDVLGGVAPDGRTDAVQALREMDVRFLLALGAGIATAVVSITRVVHVGITDFPVPTFGFFFGLIAASAWVLFSEVEMDTPGRIGAAVAGFVFAFVLSGQAAASLGTSAPVTFVAGAIAISAMILPGISGSLLLILLGQYEYMTGTLKAFVDGLLGLALGGPVGPVAESGVVVVAFMLGAVVGLFTVAHAVRWALEHHREPTLAFLVALIVGALRAPVVSTTNQLAELGRTWTTEGYAVFAVAAVLGAVLVLLVDRYAGLAEIDDEEDTAARSVD